MAKQRKTRKDKQQADHRHIKTSQITPSTMPSTPQPGVYTYTAQSASSVKKVEKKISMPTNSATTIIYQYAMQDIRKTAFMTFAIVFAQIVVYIIGTHTKMF